MAPLVAVPEPASLLLLAMDSHTPAPPLAFMNR
jgi:hypothetical protein